MSSSKSYYFPSKPRLGDIVLTKQGIGVVRFVGKVEFDDGEHFGIEIKGPSLVNGNDGSQNNKKYFECRPKRGIFVREVLRILPSEEILDKVADMYALLKENNNGNNNHFVDRGSFDILQKQYKDLQSQYLALQQSNNQLIIKNQTLNDQIMLYNESLKNKIQETANVNEKYNTASQMYNQQTGKRLSVEMNRNQDGNYNDESNNNNNNNNNNDSQYIPPNIYNVGNNINNGNGNNNENNKKQKSRLSRVLNEEENQDINKHGKSRESEVLDEIFNEFEINNNHNGNGNGNGNEDEKVEKSQKSRKSFDDEKVFEETGNWIDSSAKHARKLSNQNMKKMNQNYQNDIDDRPIVNYHTLRGVDENDDDNDMFSKHTKTDSIDSKHWINQPD